ncbi:hypothetical protein PAPYR_11973 [Paratrimastix pyriformis]|uniref:Uncharacterized protein n=1 Tax=Paratrimastix pyriformis TaxID=342808 RepID=A0ABQ8U9Q0_9EUKA|nr:hypothetical protein PAPYR_11973 [Paratrimastix pyriformis]
MRCDLLIAQKDKSTAGTDMTCQILFEKFLDVTAVLRACCASVHSFLVWPGHETSGKLDGSREESLSSHPLSALLGETPLVISAHSPSSECVPSAPTYTFQSLPIIPAHPIPTSEGHDGAAPSREGEHPCKAENSALVRLAHSRVALFHSISAPLLGALRCCCLEWDHTSHTDANYTESIWPALAHDHHPNTGTLV